MKYLIYYNNWRSKFTRLLSLLEFFTTETMRIRYGVERGDNEGTIGYGIPVIEGADTSTKEI